MAAERPGRPYVVDGLPDLRGLGPDDFYTEAEAREQAEYEAECAAERRMGC